MSSDTMYFILAVTTVSLVAVFLLWTNEWFVTRRTLQKRVKQLNEKRKPPIKGVFFCEAREDGWHKVTYHLTMTESIVAFFNEKGELEQYRLNGIMKKLYRKYPETETAITTILMHAKEVALPEFIQEEQKRKEQTKKEKEGAENVIRVVNRKMKTKG